MSDLKQKFRDWLIQQGNKSGTITSYLSRLQKISDKDWDNLTSNIIPFLVKYYELANKEYYLDRVTILHALEYFSKISDNIYKNTNISTEFDVKLYIFDGKNDYFICDTTLKVLYDDLLLINRYLYESNDTFENKYNSSIDPVNLSMLIVDLKENCPVELQKLAIHIVYNKKQINDTKTALNKYCNFLYATYKTANYDCKTNNLITYIQILNPNKTINNNFIETRPITGKYARQVKPNLQVTRETEFGYVYTLRDLAAIFDIDYYTAMNLINRFEKEYRIKTVLHDYYSSDATNRCLNKYHHYKDKNITDIYSAVDYSLTGVEQWCTRNEAMKHLGIGKHAFYHYISKKCLYIDYAEKAPKYYIPEINYLATSANVRRVRNRKSYKNKLIQNKSDTSYY